MDVIDCLGRSLPVTRTFADGSYECPYCSYAVQVGTPSHAAGRCPNPACFARGGGEMPPFPVERAKQVLAEQEARERAEAERAELVRVRAETARQRADEHERRVHQAGIDAASKNACVQCAMALARAYRVVRFVRHRSPCPRAQKSKALPGSLPEHLRAKKPDPQDTVRDSVEVLFHAAHSHATTRSALPEAPRAGKTYEVDGCVYRVVPVGYEVDGVPGRTKWALEHRLSEAWVREAHVYLAGEGSEPEAVSRLLGL